MQKSKSNSFIPKFSHVYVEKNILNHSITKNILQKFSKSKIIQINDYKEVFARSKQDFGLQKKSMKLILAEKKENFIYAGAGISQDFGNEHFYYTSSIFNCLYNCEYCYLQGMFPSANLVMFVNIEDYFSEIQKLLQQHPVYLSISYESDLLALEKIAPFASMWIKFAQENPNLTIEIRTKSVNYISIKHLIPTENIILGWTLSPDQVIQKYEHDTPSLDTRLSCIRQAIDDGWKVRLSFDPILYVDEWKIVYKEMVQKTFQLIPAHQIADLSIGVFRISKNYLKKMRKQNNTSTLIHYPYEIRDGVYTYPEPIMKELIDYVYQEVNTHTDANKIFTL